MPLTQLPSATIVQTEISLGWAHTNPDIAAARFAEFFAEHPAPEWVSTVDFSRKHYVLLRARNDGGDITEPVA